MAQVEQTAERKAYAAMRTGFNALLLEVEPSIVNDLLQRFEEYVVAAHAPSVADAKAKYYLDILKRIAAGWKTPQDLAKLAVEHEFHAADCPSFMEEEDCTCIQSGAPSVAPSQDLGNYVCDDDTFPQEATFSNGRVVKIAFREDGRPFLMISPKSEYPKPCGICDGVIQSSSDLDWHGYGNCRDVPDAIFKDVASQIGQEINRVNRARGHVLTAKNGSVADVMPTEEIVCIVEQVLAKASRAAAPSGSTPTEEK